MSKTKRKWIILDFSNSDSLRAQDVPYDASSSVKDELDKKLAPLEVTQTTHGLSVLQWVYINSSGDYIQADASDLAKSQVVGVVSAVADVNNFTLSLPGQRAIGFSSLTAGSVYYLSEGALGAITVTPPNIRKAVCVADSATSVILISERFNGEILKVVDSHSANYSILTKDSGSTLVGTAALTFTLPTASAGMNIRISKRTSGNIVIQSGAGDTIADSAVAGTLTNSSSAEDWAHVYLEAVDDTMWIFEGLGTWTTS